MIHTRPSLRTMFPNPEEFRELHQMADRSFLVIALLYLVMLAALTLVYFAKELPVAAAIPCFIIAFVAIGWAQYSMGNGLHEAVHHNLRNRNNDLWAAILTAHPFGLTMSYRTTHLLHHRYLGTDQDPERELYSHFPKTKLALVRRFIWMGSGLPALIQFVQMQRDAGSRKMAQGNSWELLSFGASQVIILFAFWTVFGNPLWYLFFWAAPIATVGKLLSSTRLLCEHGSPDSDWVVRTIHANRWQTWLMGAFDFNYHAEHHLFASVPYSGLRPLFEKHREYVQQMPDYRPFDGRLEYYEGGYLFLIAHWFKILPWRTANA